MDMQAIKSLAPYTLPRRKRESSKQDYGRLLLVGGCAGYSGAPTLASRAAVRAGAGLVHLAVPESIYTVAAVKNDEAMVMPLPADAAGRFASNAADGLSGLLEKCDALCIGPGLGRSAELTALVERLLLAAPCPVVLDADALYALGRLGPDILRGTRHPAVLTPHEGEFVHSLGRGISPDRVTAAVEYAREKRCVLVLKGAHTVVAFPDGNYYVNQTGNPGLARGGSGDALTGITGALLCQFPAEMAVPLAVYLHGLAGDLAAEKYGEYGMTITDVISQLPMAMKLITEE